MIEIKNAVIKSAKLDISERGFLDCWIYLDYGSSCQGFGGYALYLPKSWDHHSMQSLAGHFIFRAMEVAGVGKWEDMAGKTVRARCELDKIHAIGHIIKEDWFCPAEDFATLKNS